MLVAGRRISWTSLVGVRSHFRRTTRWNGKVVPAKKLGTPAEEEQKLAAVKSIPWPFRGSITKRRPGDKDKLLFIKPIDPSGAVGLLSNTVNVNPEFFNKNPRNLEMMNLAIRRTGWVLEAERRDYYNKIVLERTPQHLTASVLHVSGRVVVSASSREFAISKFLYRNTDASAAENIARVLARRMLETGILNVFNPYTEEDKKNNRLDIFLKAMEKFGITLKEDERIKTRNPYGDLSARKLK